MFWADGMVSTLTRKKKKGSSKGIFCFDLCIKALLSLTHPFEMCNSTIFNIFLALDITLSLTSRSRQGLIYFLSQWILDIYEWSYRICDL